MIKTGLYIGPLKWKCMFCNQHCIMLNLCRISIDDECPICTDKSSNKNLLKSFRVTSCCGKGICLECSDITLIPIVVKNFKLKNTDIDVLVFLDRLERQLRITQNLKNQLSIKNNRNKIHGESIGDSFIIKVENKVYNLQWRWDVICQTYSLYYEKNYNNNNYDNTINSYFKIKDVKKRLLIPEDYEAFYSKNRNKRRWFLILK